MENSIIHPFDSSLINHHQPGTRIVEFDKAQHFTPSLYTVLTKQSLHFQLAFADYYHATLKDIAYLNHEAQKKDRIKQRFDLYPLHHDYVSSAVKNEKHSGYLESKENDFKYVGGRLTQSAYYNSLRNAAHISPMNQGFKPILRFQKQFFDDKSGVIFSRIIKAGIKASIKTA